MDWAGLSLYCNGLGMVKPWKPPKPNHCERCSKFCENSLFQLFTSCLIPCMRYGRTRHLVLSFFLPFLFWPRYTVRYPICGLSSNFSLYPQPHHSATQLTTYSGPCRLRYRLPQKGRQERQCSSKPNSRGRSSQLPSSLPSSLLPL